MPVPLPLLFSSTIKDMLRVYCMNLLRWCGFRRGISDSLLPLCYRGWVNFAFMPGVTADLLLTVVAGVSASDF